MYSFEEACEILKQQLQDQIDKLDLQLKSKWLDETLPSKMSLDD